MSDWSDIANSVLLDASGALGSISFVANSTWRVLTAQAGNGIAVWSSVTTVGGNLQLDVSNVLVPFEIFMSASVAFSVQYALSLPWPVST